MEALNGSWQYENTSSANEIISLGSPQSPDFYSLQDYSGGVLFADAFEKTILDDSNPFIGIGGESQLLSAANISNPLPITPAHHGVDKSPVANTEDLSSVEFDFDSFLGINTLGQKIITQDDVSQALDEVSVNLVREELPPQTTEMEQDHAFAYEIIEDVGANSIVDVEPIEHTEIDEAIQELLLQGEALGFSPMKEYTEAEYDESVSSSPGIGSIHDMEDQEMNIELSFEDYESIASLASTSQTSSAMSSDAEDDAQEMTLDALLRQEYSKAEVMASTLGRSKGRQAIPGSSKYSDDPDYKPERRGRKPSSAQNAKSWTNVKDKALRKKQQNKAAATKYRQKKKEEAFVSMQVENGLILEFNKLTDQKNKLAEKVSQLKELLREKLAKAKAKRGSR